MKQHFFIIINLLFFYGNAQVAIGKDFLQSNYSILEFKDNENKAIILPYLSEIQKSTEEGALWVDSKNKKVVAYSGEKIIDLTPSSNVIIDQNESSETEGGIIISDIDIKEIKKEDKGILQLESKSKALILPKVQSVENIKNPIIGTIVYEIKKQALAIFNGNRWYFWK
ncbi:hypothetical protein [Ornithobacterium rhinotracheale]|uniref:hypothetical protein n=1 Tax=Ornithobacterium rhinotracheale TaxID=28251 RepID=UPI00403637E3